MKFAPIALFAYKRPDHLTRTLEALVSNPEAAASRLYIFCDGARDRDDATAVRAVRKLARVTSGFASVDVIERDRNFGLAASIIDGVTEVCDIHGSIIVIEDDLVVSPHFLRYMNAALHLYQDQERVISIHGYVYPIATTLPETFFLRGADCWGWATWKRGWALFEPNGKQLLRELKNRHLLNAFDLGGVAPYTQMLRAQISGRNNSWAIRWHASAFLADRLTLYPGRSLVSNIGNDYSGTHSIATDVYDGPLTSNPIELKPMPILESPVARQAFEQFFRQQNPSLMQRLRRRWKGV